MRRPLSVRRALIVPMPVLLPAVTLIGLIGAIAFLQSEILSYAGLDLLLKFVTPIVFAALAQMCVMAMGDIDLGTGAFMSLVGCIAATVLVSAPIFGFLLLLCSVAAYGVLGALIHLARLPSIVATLGASFVWFGAALVVLPTPGGQAPDWLSAFVNWAPPAVPLPVALSVVAAAAGEFLLMRTTYGIVLRGIGSNPVAINRSGWSLLTGKVVMYLCAGALGTIAGLLMTGLNTSGDPRFGGQYTLQSIAAVIVGGGEFTGGIVFPIGTVIGATIMLLIGSMLSFANISPDWQLAVQGGVLILVVALRGLIQLKRT
jgi:ribose/xylose/arabinose/galactoside ABC-type transport system permease subunit